MPRLYQDQDQGRGRPVAGEIDAILDAGAAPMQYFRVMLGIAAVVAPGPWPGWEELCRAYDYERGIDLEALRTDAEALRAAAESAAAQRMAEAGARERVSGAWPDATGQVAVQQMGDHDRHSESIVEILRRVADAAGRVPGEVSDAVVQKVRRLSEFSQTGLATSLVPSAAIAGVGWLAGALAPAQVAAAARLRTQLEKDIALFDEIIADTVDSVQDAFASVIDAAERLDTGPYPLPSFTPPVATEPTGPGASSGAGGGVGGQAGSGAASATSQPAQGGVHSEGGSPSVVSGGSGSRDGAVGGRVRAGGARSSRGSTTPGPSGGSGYSGVSGPSGGVPQGISSAPAATPTAAAPTAATPSATPPVTAPGVSSAPAGQASPSGVASQANPLAGLQGLGAGLGSSRLGGLGGLNGVGGSGSSEPPSWLSSLIPKIAEQLGIGHLGSAGDSKPGADEVGKQEDAKGSDGRDGAGRDGVGKEGAAKDGAGKEASGKDGVAKEGKDRAAKDESGNGGVGEDDAAKTAAGEGRPHPKGEGRTSVTTDPDGRTTKATMRPDGVTVDVTVTKPDGGVERATLTVGPDGRLACSDGPVDPGERKVTGGGTEQSHPQAAGPQPNSPGSGASSGGAHVGSGAAPSATSAQHPHVPEGGAPVLDAGGHAAAGQAAPAPSDGAPGGGGGVPPTATPPKRGGSKMNPGVTTTREPEPTRTGAEFALTE
ncbi:hypothetical protein P0W64_14755 [Tsukamurella sp. 8F]|uniref:hypothetical protein n=1 Tax=unclassified Tsukamurella TaxID=2633480 RepID=UPI0023B8C37A|nr:MULTISPECIES: hypothetical protein [unclassified Tsukamurella]MDF0531761.1 hypothetical protein [Tsukamurella sp. 8J]MDF0588037.1 hypothetical protein [Tsukamurella sp. 8F]